MIGEPDGWIPRALDGRVLITRNSPTDAFFSNEKPDRGSRFVMNLFMLGNGVPPEMLKRWYKRKFGIADGSKILKEVDDTLVRVQSGKYKRYWDVTAQSYADQIIPDERDWKVELRGRPKMIARKGRVIMTEDLPIGPPRRFKRPTFRPSSKVLNPYKKKKIYPPPYTDIPIARPTPRAGPAKKISPVGSIPTLSSTKRSIPSKKIANPYKKRKVPMTSLEALQSRYNNF